MVGIICDSNDFTSTVADDADGEEDGQARLQREHLDERPVQRESPLAHALLLPPKLCIQFF